MYCPNCGTGFDDSDHFCRGCGKKLAAVIVKPGRYGAGPPSDAALRGIGQGVLADVRVRRVGAIWGVVIGGIAVLFAITVLLTDPIGLVFLLIAAGGLAYSSWEFVQYDGALRRMEMAKDEVDDAVRDALERGQS